MSKYSVNSYGCGRRRMASTSFLRLYSIQVSMKSQVTHEGKLFLDITVTEYKPLEKTDEKFDTGS